jgi:hypothetical protein
LGFSQSPKVPKNSPDRDFPDLAQYRCRHFPSEDSKRFTSHPGSPEKLQ